MSNQHVRTSRGCLHKERLFNNTAFMSLDPGNMSQRSEIILVAADPRTPGDVNAAVELGNHSSATLGCLPIAAYQDAAERGNLLLARDRDGKVVGYALYGLARNRVRLTHLCVDSGYRKRGLGRRLVDHICDRHRDYLGVHVRCRRDYGLAEMWIKLGFSQRSETSGRGKTPHVLVNWWRDHGHATLFTRLDQDVLVRAAIDLNVLRDLADSSRPDTRDSRSLIDEQISDRLELVRTAALDAEIDCIDGPLRRQCITHAHGMPPVRAELARTAEARAELLAAARSAIADYPRTSQDEFDLRHVSDAIAAGLNVFVTRDEHLTRLFAKTAESHGLRVLRAADVVVHLDELVRAEAYRPAALLETAMHRRLLGLDHENALQGLVSKATAERPRDFAKHVRDLVLEHRDRVGIVGPDSSLVAAYCAYLDGTVLVVPLVRVADHALRDTLARQVLFLLRQQAANVGADAIRLSDPHVSPAVRLAALSDGFNQLDGSLWAYVLNACDTAARMTDRAVAAARSVGQKEPSPLRSDMPAAAAAELERAWWPAKITDSLLPTYLVPIRQSFSVDLLGVPSSLFPREEALGLSREHVYYRSAAGITPQAPARLLWYMSGAGQGARHSPAVIACSHLDAVVSGTPADLHSRFRHLGVWTTTR